MEVVDVKRKGYKEKKEEEILKEAYSLGKNYYINVLNNELDFKKMTLSRDSLHKK